MTSWRYLLLLLDSIKVFKFNRCLSIKKFILETSGTLNKKSKNTLKTNRMLVDFKCECKWILAINEIISAVTYKSCGSHN